MKKNVQWLVIFVFALLLLTGCKGSEAGNAEKKWGVGRCIIKSGDIFEKRDESEQ